MIRAAPAKKRVHRMLGAEIRVIHAGKATGSSFTWLAALRAWRASMRVLAFGFGKAVSGLFGS